MEEEQQMVGEEERKAYKRNRRIMDKKTNKMGKGTEKKIIMKRKRKLLPYAFDMKGIKRKIKVQSYLSSCLSLGK
jgi:hypothetical protein